jgi:hypothetical protein
MLGFVATDVVHFNEGIWFSKLNDEQIKSVEEFLKKY